MRQRRACAFICVRMRAMCLGQGNDAMSWTNGDISMLPKAHANQSCPRDEWLEDIRRAVRDEQIARERKLYPTFQSRLRAQAGCGTEKQKKRKRDQTGKERGVGKEMPSNVN